MMNDRGFAGVRIDALFVRKKAEIHPNVIPAKAGIQKYRLVKKFLDPGLHRDDDFLRSRHLMVSNFALAVLAWLVFG